MFFEEFSQLEVEPSSVAYKYVKFTNKDRERKKSRDK